MRKLILVFGVLLAFALLAACAPASAPTAPPPAPAATQPAAPAATRPPAPTAVPPTQTPVPPTATQPSAPTAVPPTQTPMPLAATPQPTVAATTAAPAEATPAPTTAPASNLSPGATDKYPFPPGKSGWVVKSFIGQELNYNINNTLYKVPANGEVFIVLDPGKYNYSVNIPGKGKASGTVELKPDTLEGQTWEGG